MKVQTFSIVAGSELCNAHCPYCISKMTYNPGMENKEPEVNWRNFDIACAIAKKSGAITAMITGKGEPTLFPEQVTKYTEALKKHEFPLIELQTNGIAISEDKKKYGPHLKDWYERGMTTISISIVHYKNEKNKRIFAPGKNSYINLPESIVYLHDKGFSVRLSCVMLDKYICNSAEVEELMGFAKQNAVEQLTLRPVNKPENSKNRLVEKWVDKNCLKEGQLEEIQGYLKSNGKKLMELPHGATVYDLFDQNVCMTNCLTMQPDSEEIRQLIFFPDGHLHYDWQHRGAILL